MKKIYSLILTLVVMFSFTVGSAFSAIISKQMNANIKTKRVPAGTVINLRVLDPVTSSNANIGDQFDLMVVDNILVDSTVAIPQGSVVRGSLEEVQAPKMLFKGGCVRLYFDHIVSSTGKQVPFYAGIYNNPNTTYDGALSSKTTYRTALQETMQNTKKLVVVPTSWAWERGEEIANGGLKYLFGPVTAIFTAPVAGFYFLGDAVADVFKKGDDMNINQGETIQVQLLKPIDMPVF